MHNASGLVDDTKALVECMLLRDHLRKVLFWNLATNLRHDWAQNIVLCVLQGANELAISLDGGDVPHPDRILSEEA